MRKNKITKARQERDIELLTRSISKLEDLYDNRSLSNENIQTAQKYHNYLASKYDSSEDTSKYPHIYFLLYELQALIDLSEEKDEDAEANLQVAVAVRNVTKIRTKFISKSALQWDKEENNENDVYAVQKSNSFKKFFLFFLVLIVSVAVIASLITYSIKKSDINKQKDKIQSQLNELPDLEKDIFTKCMEDKGANAKNIAFCQENTQKQMHTLSQDLLNAKKDLENKKWYQVVQ